MEAASLARLTPVKVEMADSSTPTKLRITTMPHRNVSSSVSAATMGPVSLSRFSSMPRSTSCGCEKLSKKVRGRALRAVSSGLASRVVG